MHAGWAYFASFPDTAKEFARYAEAKLTMPVLAIGGDKAYGEQLGAQMKLVASEMIVEDEAADLDEATPGR